MMLLVVADAISVILNDSIGIHKLLNT